MGGNQIQEVVIVGNYDNTNDFRLESDNVPLVLDSVTQIDANVAGLDVTSTNQSSDLIRWNVVGFEVGKIQCKFGAIPNLTGGMKNCWFIVFDPTNLNGVVFGPIDLVAIELP